MQVVYRLIVLYFAIHIVISIFERKRLRERLGAAAVLVLFALRFLMVK